mmetsp:Transcript_25595/g.28713  ORF Transcript_25595/g.28713 Transcript_25595/m.28713 type:complete len:158 (-) Transcript_25595:678-1151(-)
MTVLCHGSFSFVNLNHHNILVVLMGRKCLGFFGRDGCSTVDKLSHDSTNSFNTLRKGCNIQKKNFSCCITTFTGQDTSLDGCTVSNSLIGIDSLRWFLSAEIFRNKLLNLWNTSRTANHYNFVDFALAQISIFHYTGNRPHCLLKQVIVQLLETSSS